MKTLDYINNTMPFDLNLFLLLPNLWVVSDSDKKYNKNRELFFSDSFEEIFKDKFKMLGELVGSEAFVSDTIPYTGHINMHYVDNKIELDFSLYIGLMNAIMTELRGLEYYQKYCVDYVDRIGKIKNNKEGFADVDSKIVALTKDLLRGLKKELASYSVFDVYEKIYFPVLKVKYEDSDLDIRTLEATKQKFMTILERTLVNNVIIYKECEKPVTEEDLNKMNLNKDKFDLMMAFTYLLAADEFAMMTENIGKTMDNESDETESKMEPYYWNRRYSACAFITNVYDYLVTHEPSLIKIEESVQPFNHILDYATLLKKVETFINRYPDIRALNKEDYTGLTYNEAASLYKDYGYLHDEFADFDAVSDYEEQYDEELGYERIVGEQKELTEEEIEKLIKLHNDRRYLFGDSARCTDPTYPKTYRLRKIYKDIHSTDSLKPLSEDIVHHYDDYSVAERFFNIKEEELYCFYGMETERVFEILMFTEVYETVKTTLGEFTLLPNHIAHNYSSIVMSKEKYAKYAGEALDDDGKTKSKVIDRKKIYREIENKEPGISKFNHAGFRITEAEHESWVYTIGKYKGNSNTLKRPKRK